MLPVSCLKRDWLRAGGQGQIQSFSQRVPPASPSPHIHTSLAPCQQGNLFKQLLLTQQGSSLPLRILLLFSFHGTSRRDLDWLKPWLPHGFLGLFYPEEVSRGSLKTRLHGIWQSSLLSWLWPCILPVHAEGLPPPASPPSPPSCAPKELSAKMAQSVKCQGSSMVIWV